MTTCQNPVCDMLAQEGPRCFACRTYWYRHHVERPERLARPAPRPVRTVRYCALCGRRIFTHWSLCAECRHRPAVVRRWLAAEERSA